jgi:hypothetical protein
VKSYEYGYHSCSYPSLSFGGRGLLGFELRALCLLGRHSTAWIMLPALFNLIIFEIGTFCLGQPGLLSPYYTLSLVDEMTGACNCVQLLVEMWVLWTFCPDCPQTTILPILASQIATIIGISHEHLTLLLLLYTFSFPSPNNSHHTKLTSFLKFILLPTSNNK